jgi:carboxymethylenebutenolidase
MLWPLRASILLLLLLVQAVWAQSKSPLTEPAGQCDLRYSRTTFPFQGRSISIEVFEPVRPGRFPLILFVHGSAGIFTHNNDSLPSRENFGEQSVARACFVTALVHYFDVDGIRSTQDRTVMAERAPLWTACLATALDTLQSRHSVDRSRIGVHGESLGGFLAVDLAMRDSRIAAVSVVSGGLVERPDGPPLRPVYPPLIIQHGSRDVVVPVGQALALEKAFRSRNSPVTLHVMEGAGHYQDPEQHAQVIDRCIGFFNRYLCLRTGKARQN